MTPSLPLPPFYAPEHAERWDYAPDPTTLLAQAGEWRRQQGIHPASHDRRKVHLLLIDLQKDFCFPQGALFVGGRSGRGALDDSRRIAEFIYRHLPSISAITTTHDAHLAFQIFFPSFWVDRDGAALSAHRVMTVRDLDAGDVRPKPELAAWLCGGDVAALERQVRHYCASLEAAGKYQLYLWPPHCLVGSDGHSLVGVIQEARLFHAFVRGVQGACELKGEHPLTENYSVLSPEVLTWADGSALAQRNAALVDELLRADAIYVAGQAASHCVKSTVDDLLSEIQRRDPALAQRVHILADCMSSVAIPDGAGGFVVDFSDATQAAFARWAAAGMHIVSSQELGDTL